MVQEVEAPVTISDKAAEKAKAILAERGKEKAYLRVFVVGGGCSGYQYGMAISEEREEDDIAVENGGVTVLVDQESLPLMRGAEIDYQDDLMKSGFTIFNPNAVKGCACGSSFQTSDGGGQARSCC
jgi:iron-sulfur cluster assembly protein